MIVEEGNGFAVEHIATAHKRAIIEQDSKFIEDMVTTEGSMDQQKERFKWFDEEVAK